jgi:hypothetical protein
VTGPLVAFTSGESAELLALAEQIGRVGVIDWQVQTGTVRLSPSAQAIYGLESFDGRYDSWIATVYREDAIRLRDTIASALQEKLREFELEFRIIRQSDKQLRWIHARRLPFYDAAGIPVRVVGVSVDVTDRKRELSSCATSPKRWKRPSRNARGRWKPKTRRARRSRNRFGGPRKWRRSVSLPAASRTTSTIFSPSCWAAST